jgi:hypothetical protein
LCHVDVGSVAEHLAHGVGQCWAIGL